MWSVCVHIVDRFLNIFDPPPPLWTTLLNNAYVVTWTFGKLPLPHAMSTWFMNAPLLDLEFLSYKYTLTVHIENKFSPLCLRAF